MVCWHKEKKRVHFSCSWGIVLSTVIGSPSNAPPTSHLTALPSFIPHPCIITSFPQRRRTRQPNNNYVYMCFWFHSPTPWGEWLLKRFEILLNGFRASKAFMPPVISCQIKNMGMFSWLLFIFWRGRRPVPGLDQVRFVTLLQLISIHRPAENSTLRVCNSN